MLPEIHVAKSDEITTDFMRPRIRFNPWMIIQ
jgi:hypothetical protein